MQDKAILTKFLTHKVSPQINLPFFQKILSHQKWRPFLIFEFFTKIAKHKNAYILKMVRNRAISMKFFTHRVSLQSGHPNFQKIFVSSKMAAILNCQIFHKICKTQKCLDLENHSR